MSSSELRSDMSVILAGRVSLSRDHPQCGQLDESASSVSRTRPHDRQVCASQHAESPIIPQLYQPPRCEPLRADDPLCRLGCAFRLWFHVVSCPHRRG